MSVSAILYAFKGSLFTIVEPFFYISWWSFLASLIYCAAVSLITKPEPIEKLRGLVYGMVQKDGDLQDAMENNIKE
jgi:solute:Na+ symporter, SSS family